MGGVVLMFTLRLKWLLLQPVLRVDFRSCKKSENRDSGGLCVEVGGCRRPAPQLMPGPMRLPLPLRGHCLLSCPRALGPQVPSPHHPPARLTLETFAQDYCVWGFSVIWNEIYSTPLQLVSFSSCHQSKVLRRVSHFTVAVTATAFR